ncbi:membrane-associating domain-containing protein [Talaromyces proteolyticus]|uniref:Membrane-associating domain-containing protein n=1 Tax=Talaromyces proteolyticus TaxID=1131652 RepID=A0AAD4PVS4_9EURO|nr:membrane-associating domain-containing protein [Talaromyces proteolyticus]KAH8691117.1 membrane-associating domain-containing protein [Talaromyces proteolyticus]
MSNHSLHHLNWVLPVRIVQAVFAIIILGLTAYVVNVELSWYWYSSGTVNFDLFNSIWTLVIALPYLSLVPVFFSNLSHVYAVLAVEIVTMIFWFAGFIALGALLPPPRACHSGPCSSLQAATVFASFEWVLFAVTTAFTVRLALQSRNDSTVHAKTSGVEPHAGV